MTLPKSSLLNCCCGYQETKPAPKHQHLGWDMCGFCVFVFFSSFGLLYNWIFWGYPKLAVQGFRNFLVEDSEL